MRLRETTVGPTSLNADLRYTQTRVGVVTEA
jgi:hypothetical protein